MSSPQHGITAQKTNDLLLIFAFHEPIKLFHLYFNEVSFYAAFIILYDVIKIPGPVHHVTACGAMNLSEFLLQLLLGQLKALSRSSVVK
jgi:hypothetical protein